ncbi:MAG TPA: tetratricopeptide repeat protein [Chitinophagaceae bacterium]|nr:tetratricopeptide repeat protein [Chitinophagaceae bacterium]
MKKGMTILLCLYIFCFQSQAQQSERVIQSGNDFYKKQKYSEAEKEYRKAAQTDSSPVAAKFNLANTLYKLGEKTEAIGMYDNLIGIQKDSEMLSDLYYNKGVVLGSRQKLKESIQAYENALLNAPGDQETRENLQKALLELKKQNAQKKDNNFKKKKQQNKLQPPLSAMNQKEAEKRLKDLEQKEKEIQQRIQKEKSATGGSQQKDW